MRYSELVDVYERLGSTSKRLEKTYFVSELLKKADDESLHMAVLLLEGRIYPAWDEREAGVASQMMLKAISSSSGIPVKEVEKEWKRTGDLGKAAENLASRKKQATLHKEELTVRKVFENLRKLPEITGQGSVDRKVALIVELLSSARPNEARYIVRTVLQQLRVGIGSGTLRDAIAWAYLPKVAGVFFKCEKCGEWMPAAEKCLNCNGSIDARFAKAAESFTERNALRIRDAGELKSLKGHKFIIAEDEPAAREAYNKLLDSVQKTYDLTNDFSIAALKAKKGDISGHEDAEIEIGRPIKAMLALKVDTIAEGFEKAGKPLQAEFKFDGFRVQLHKKGKDIKVFTRRLENVTRQFPDIAEIAGSNVKGDNFILDAEAVGYDRKTSRYLPFQNVSQRIKRKYDIEKMAAQFPVEVNVFDIIAYEGKSMISRPFEERRKLIEKIISAEKRSILPATAIITDSEERIEKLFQEAKEKGNEGLMLKNLKAPYKPGARVGYMLKYKRTMENLDLAIVKAEWGEGKRSKWLSSYTVACISKGKLLEVGKVSTGLKEKPEEGLSFEEMTKLLKPLITKEEGKEAIVKPRIVIEVAYEEIQKSPTYG
ncbi:ATP-dependent DNA ligase [Candidatus Woesearchaeota archaeon]|nr:ATP-dependent DNA ligase [Candidatus Woesearchaeota archaeon]